MTSAGKDGESDTAPLGAGDPAVRFANVERRPVLIALRGELLAASIPLERDLVTLGRSLEADIRLNDSKASRLHARIAVEVDPQSEMEIFRITDLSSTNGTRVNGQIVSEASLTDGDKVQIGDHLFRFELHDEIDREYFRGPSPGEKMAMVWPMFVEQWRLKGGDADDR